MIAPDARTREEGTLTIPRPPLRLLLIRHGQTAWNVERRVLGRTDIALDETGRTQAARLALALGAVDAVYASPLSRARETAAPLGLPALEPDLAEMDQGELDGLDVHGLVARMGSLMDTWRADPTGIRLPGGETMDEVQARGLAALTRIAGRHAPGETIAVVTHQLVLSACLCALHGQPLARWKDHTHPNTAWSVLEWHPPFVVRQTKQEASP